MEETGPLVLGTQGLSCPSADAELVAFEANIDLADGVQLAIRPPVEPGIEEVADRTVTLCRSLGALGTTEIEQRPGKVIRVFVEQLPAQRLTGVVVDHAIPAVVDCQSGRPAVGDLQTGASPGVVERQAEEEVGTANREVVLDQHALRPDGREEEASTEGQALGDAGYFVGQPSFLDVFPGAGVTAASASPALSDRLSTVVGVGGMTDLQDEPGGQVLLRPLSAENDVGDGEGVVAVVEAAQRRDAVRRPAEVVRIQDFSYSDGLEAALGFPGLFFLVLLLEKRDELRIQSGGRRRWDGNRRLGLRRRVGRLSLASTGHGKERRDQNDVAEKLAGRRLAHDAFSVNWLSVNTFGPYSDQKVNLPILFFTNLSIYYTEVKYR